MAEGRTENTFTVGQTPQVSVSNVRGTVKVQGEERDDIHVVAIKHSEKCRDPERTEIEMYQEGDRVIVKTQHQKKHRWQGSQICPVDYTVQVPTQCDVAVKQVFGAVYAGSVTGQVDINAVQGTVKLHEIAGHTQVKAVDAAVDGDRWSGLAKVDTVSGPVQVTGAQLLRVKANTVSGDLSLETTLDENGRYDFSSISGDVTLYLPSEQGAESRGTTISGHLVCDLPHQFSRRSRSGWRAKVNGGGPPVRFNSISGDLELLATKLPEN